MKIVAILLTFFSFTTLSQVTVSDATPATLDGSIATRNFVFTPGDFGGCTSLTEVEVSLTLTVTNTVACTAGAFGVHSDIAVSLESPSGTVVHLVHDFSGILIGSPPIAITYQDSGFPTVFQETAIYDDDATLLADDQTDFGAGTWQPQNPLSAFDGEDPAGTWILRVADGRSQGFPDITCYVGASVSIQCGGLPVELTSFDAIPQERSVLLNWVTQTEKDNKGFLVQRSADLSHWENLTFIDGTGSSSVSNNYSHVDQAPMAGMNYYRLIQVDFDGAETEFEVKAVDFSPNGVLVKIVPNPSNGSFIIRSSVWEQGENVQMYILNSEGRICHKESFRASGNTQEFRVESIESGVYTIKIVGDAFVSSDKFVLNKP